MTIHHHNERLRLATTSTPSATTKDEGEQQQQQQHPPGNFDSTSTTPPPNNNNNNNKKHILLIRHGLSYMNECIGTNGITFGGPNFTDIFDDDEREMYYRDSPLSDVGRDQAKRLSSAIVEIELDEQQTTTTTMTTTTTTTVITTPPQHQEEDCNDNDPPPPPSEEYYQQPTTKEILQQLELIVTSPLTRAIQTAELGLSSKIATKNNKHEHEHRDRNRNNSGVADAETAAATTTTSETTTTTTTTTTGIPVIATPLAAERLYLVSDIGTTRSDLEARYGDWIDFRTGFPERSTTNTAAIISAIADAAADDDDDDNDAPWWYQSNNVKSNNNESDSSPSPIDNNSEWRPTGEGQTYFCPGEPYDDFENRMLELCTWLERREENAIALVGHFGVFEWLLRKEENEKVEFSNCEMRVVSLDDILENVRCRRHRR